MKKLAVLAIFALASVIYAGEDTPIRNVCDSLTVSDNAVIDIVPAYIDETNWYGNPATWAEDSTTYKRHWSYKTLEIKAKSFTDMLPVSIHAGCLETRGTEFKYATWNNSKAWTEKIVGNYATYIRDIHDFQIEGHDTSNTYNFLAYVSGKIPEDDVYTASSLLPSKTFEFAFEWWYVGFTYEFVYDSIIDGKTYAVTGKRYSSTTSNDSLRAYSVAREYLDLSHPGKEIRNPYVRVQFVKVVLSDSRKLPEPESSSSVPASSSSSVPASSSSENPGTSSSHSVDVSSSSVAGSSSSGTVVSSSSQNGGSSSSVAPGTSSSAGDNGSSSSAGGNSAGTETSSSGTESQSSSSEGKTRLVTVQQQNASARVVQVRALDGSVVKNQANLAPGVYYVKNSNGKWQKMAVLPR